jgi:hypothetical protein
MPGEIIAVRSEAEILATLDENGALDKLPFMPEMLQFCGRRLRVSGQAHKTCIDDQEMRQLEDTVFLEDVRCGGNYHDSCSKACLIFWKTAWLKRVDEVSTEAGQAKISRDDLIAISTRDGNFYCQSSELINASKPLPWWYPTQYIRDLRAKHFSFAELLHSLYIATYNKVAAIRGSAPWRFVGGDGVGQSLERRLYLEPGELVRVKPLSDIKRTLDSSGKHRHLLFSPEMARFCGQTLRVRNRVENIILEGTSRQRKLKDTVLLETATCGGTCHRLCPRKSFLFWRECWLERVEMTTE